MKAKGRVVSHTKATTTRGSRTAAAGRLSGRGASQIERLLEGLQLPGRRHDLSPGKSPPARAPEAGARKAAAPGPPGIESRLSFAYVHREPPDQQVRPGRQRSWPAPATVRLACWRRSTWRVPTSEIYPNKGEDEDGMREFFKEFSSPGGIGSHCTPKRRAPSTRAANRVQLCHAFGAAFRQPGPAVTVVVGDGEAETGPLPRPGIPTSS